MKSYALFLAYDNIFVIISLKFRGKKEIIKVLHVFLAF